MHRFTVSVLLVLVLTLSGCAFWKGFKAGITGEELTAETISTTTEVGVVTGEQLKEVAPYFPSPWREILVAVIAAVTGWGAATREQKDNKDKQEEGSWDS